MNTKYILTRKTEAKIIALLIYISAVALLTPVLVWSAYAERGCFALGGEWLLMMTIPIAIVSIVQIYTEYNRG